MTVPDTHRLLAAGRTSRPRPLQDVTTAPDTHRLLATSHDETGRRTEAASAPSGCGDRA